jgi:chromosome segregation ATPase
MARNSTKENGETEELRSRVDWLDEERLKAARRMVQLEQRLTAWERKLESREKRIKELEVKLSKASGQIALAAQADTQLVQFKDEMVKLIEQYDKRRVVGDEELERLRRVEHDVHQREIADIRKAITPIDRLLEEMEHRKVEEERLAKLVGSVQNRERALAGEVETWQQALKFVEESEQTNAASVAESQDSLLENSKKIESINSRLDITNHSLARLQSSVQELTDTGAELRQQMKSWGDQVQMGELQRNKRLEERQFALDAMQEQMERYATEWVKFATQYKEAKTAVQAMVDWQQQMEQQQREASELARVEAGQMRSRWEAFLLEDDKRWKNQEVESDQRWSGAERSERKILEQLRELSESIQALESEKDTLWRIQNAQADAMKKWPRIWLEEVEKAIAHNPDSRRQPALVPVREE